MQTSRPIDETQTLPSFRGMSFFQKVHKRAYTPLVEQRGIGFGLFPFARDVAPLRRSAVSHLLGILDSGSVPAKTADNLMAISVVKEIVTDVFKESSFDWFTTSFHLGQPSGRLALQAARSLGTLREHVVSGASHLAEEVLSDLSLWALPDMLDTYLTLDTDPDSTEVEEALGWAYMLWSPDRPGHAAIGVTDGTVMEVLEDLEQDYPHLAPFGALSAWQVADATSAAQLVEDALEFAYTGDDVFHELTPREEGNFEILSFKERIEDTLSASRQLVLSPWHFDMRHPLAEAEQEAVASPSA